MSVAIVIDETTSRSPALFSGEQSRRLGHIREGPVAVVAVQNVLTEIGTKNIIEAIIVIVSNADSGCPANASQSSFVCNVGKCTIAIVLVKAISSPFGPAFEAGAGKNKNVHPAVVVVIDEGAAAAGRFQDVFLALSAAVDH